MASAAQIEANRRNARRSTGPKTDEGKDRVRRNALKPLFHAFDALGHRIGHKFWKDERDGLPLGFKGGFKYVPYRQIAPPPSDKTAALILICSVIEKHVGRLEELLAEHEEIEAEEAAERYDRAALDCSPA